MGNDGAAQENYRPEKHFLATAPAMPTSEEVFDLLQTWGEQALEAWMLIDDQRHVLWNNPAAASVLAQSEAFSLRAGQIVPLERKIALELDRFLARVVPGGPYEVECFKRADGVGHLLVRAHRVGEWRGNRVFGLRVQLTGEGFEARYANYAPIFGLTPAEAAIVADIMEGFSATQIAEHNGQSVGTVRTHLRSIYAKMDVKSREQLFFKLRPFRIF